MNLIRIEHLELSALEENCYSWLHLHSSLCKHRPIGSKLGQNIYDKQISNEMDYESTWNGTIKVVCSWISKITEFALVYTLASANINQAAPNCVSKYDQ